MDGTEGRTEVRNNERSIVVGALISAAILSVPLQLLTYTWYIDFEKVYITASSTDQWQDLSLLGALPLCSCVIKKSVDNTE